jgi:hypothetical protein
VSTQSSINRIEEMLSRRRRQPSVNILSRDYLVMEPLIRWVNNVAPPSIAGAPVDSGADDLNEHLCLHGELRCLLLK